MTGFLKRQAKAKSEEQETERKDCGCGFGRGCTLHTYCNVAPSDYRHEVFKSEAQFRTAHARALNEVRLKCEDIGIDPLGEKLVGPPPELAEFILGAARKFSAEMGIDEAKIDTSSVVEVIK